MRIGFDARYLSHGLIGGVHAYVRHLARLLPALAPGDELFYYADAKAPFELPDLPAGVTVRVLPWSSVASTVVNDIRIARWLERDRVDVAHFPANYGPRGDYALVVSIHDALNLFRLSEHWRGFGRRPRQVALMAYLGRKTRRALREADLVLASSEHARGELARMSGRPVDRITTIHLAAGEEFTEVADPVALERVRQRWCRRRFTILADGIKNPAALIGAFDALPDQVRADTGLVFFSREASPRPPVAEALAGPGVTFVAQPGTGDLVALMNIATAFVFPTWYEGFGIPLVEAMRCGTPVIASTRGSVPEVLGGAGLLFDVERPGDLTHHLQSVLESEPLRADLAAKSLRRAQEFSWRATASRTLDAYRRAAAARAAVHGR